MSLVVNHNLMAMNAARNLTTIYGRLSNSVQRLSSGMRINSAADDAAGLAIRELMRADIATLNQGIRNASDAISMIQTAEGAMSVIDEKLIRMKELAEQAATGTYTTAQREIMDSEYQAMAAEIDRIATATDFNGVKLLDGSMAALHAGSGLKVHFGTGNEAAEDYYYISVGDMRATVGTGLRVGNSDTYDTWDTTHLNMTSGDSLFANTGVFGLQYTTDGGSTWETYGWLTIDANDTLTSVVEEFNTGPQYRTTIDFTTATSVNIVGQTLTVNGHVFTFSTVSDWDASASTETTIMIGNISAGGAASIAWATGGTINYILGTLGGFDSSINAIAQWADGSATVNLYHEEFGAPTSSTSLGASDANIDIDTTWTTDIQDAITAKAALADSYGYELQFRANQSGGNYQVRMLMGGGDAVEYSGGGVTLQAISGTTLPATVLGSWYAAPTNMWNASDWEQVENGSGNTSWAAKDILTQSAAQQALAGLDSAIGDKDQARANLGAMQNRLENTITNLQIQAENLQAAESRISDVDVAEEMTEFTRNNILAQAAVAMLAQANSLPSLALTLLGG